MIEKLTNLVVATSDVLGSDLMSDSRTGDVALSYSRDRQEAQRWVASAVGINAPGGTPEDALRSLQRSIAGRITRHLADLDAERARTRALADALARLVEA